MISLFGSNVGKEELDLIKDSLDNQWLGMGPKVAAFEKEIAAKCDVDDFVFVNSGSNALQLAVRLLDLPKGSEVIIPSFTWIACANAVLLEGLVPVFCDVDPKTFNICPEYVEPKITSKTAAIMVVHYAGKPVDVDAIRQFNLPIIEDAAHAVDSYYKGKHCGTLGDTGIFSFDAVKNLTTAEGGGVFAKNAGLLSRARQLRYCGIGKSGFQASATKARWWEYDISESFPKMTSTDVNAAIGLAQLKKLDGFQQRREKIWSAFTIALNESWGQEWIETPVGPESHEQHSYFTYCIKIKQGSRDALAAFLYENEIYSSLRFHPLHLNSYYKCRDSLPHCEMLNQIALNLPLHHRLSDDNVDHIINTLKKFRQKHIDK